LTCFKGKKGRWSLQRSGRNLKIGCLGESTKKFEYFLKKKKKGEGLQEKFFVRAEPRMVDTETVRKEKERILHAASIHVGRGGRKTELARNSAGLLMVL